MNEQDIQLVRSTTHIYLHSATTVNFNEPLEVACNLNTLGTLRVFNLTKKSPNLEVFLHISTAYVNCNKRGFIEEKLYRLEFDAEEMLQILTKTDPKELAKQSKQLMGSYPNSYTLTKSLTEHLLVNRRENVPLVIFRPSIIGSSYREPYPGWLVGWTLSVLLQLCI